MKKMLFSTVFTIMGLAALTAQDIKIGANGGVNLSTLQPDLTDPATRTSFHLGGMVEIPLVDALYLQPELLYSSQGVKDKSDDDEVIKLDYLSLPVMVKYYVWDALSVEVGPQFGILLSAKREDNGETEDIKDITKSTDIGFALGLGYKLNNGLNFGARFYLGSDVNDIEEDSDKIKNRVFQISVGYFF
ncbi:PorT family protein [Flavobacteriaceae bacterium F89]|uniref:PorT family protein n=1 Tax=Cerina litoralis TaxID=2874477 RepID=A0AAE3EWE5_9FLAO|nr:porin family protein [Cerina litoralis]MCG2461508.1 PorT family protein [Cerina litoralis]